METLVLTIPVLIIAAVFAREIKFQLSLKDLTWDELQKNAEVLVQKTPFMIN